MRSLARGNGSAEEDSESLNLGAILSTKKDAA